MISNIILNKIHTIREGSSNERDREYDYRR